MWNGSGMQKTRQDMWSQEREDLNWKVECHITRQSMVEEEEEAIMTCGVVPSGRMAERWNALVAED